MCDAESNNVGDPVPDDTVIYRALNRRFDIRPGGEVNQSAFQKDGSRAVNSDGFSFRTTPDACNDRDHFGILRIRVSEIREINRGLDVRFYRFDSHSSAQHALHGQAART
jgi:hypothetical protein